jgi:hypothetical protein
VKGHRDARTNLVGFAAFAAGLLLLGWLSLVFH